MRVASDFSHDEEAGRLGRILFLSDRAGRTRLDPNAGIDGDRSITGQGALLGAERKDFLLHFQHLLFHGTDEYLDVILVLEVRARRVGQQTVAEYSKS